MFAIIKTGGKQFKVQNGDVIFVEKLNAAEGETVKFDVLMLASDDEVKVGTPVVEVLTSPARCWRTASRPRSWSSSTSPRRTIAAAQVIVSLSPRLRSPSAKL